MAPGITETRDQFIKKLRHRFGKIIAGIDTSSCPPVGTCVSVVSSYLVKEKLLLNKGETENLYLYFGSLENETVDLEAFLLELKCDISGKDPVFMEETGTSPNDAHLSLSGTMHLDFSAQYKPFPSHWGTPPNAQMKGHNGIMRELPGGYGKGNAPMAAWVRENMAKDKGNMSNERGVSPYPFGNYSLGCTGLTY
jgi:hypothetical protein